ncbi:MAG: hypothetical protein CVV25_01025 [Ignavibacteriae bacterium HGW-Ignavibacteriae-4]|nr:MAG: hypothetical protein CVV25_01025 [Ignavibacteriae bacterium HGW-Ignavibacteriae-4]
MYNFYLSLNLRGIEIHTITGLLFVSGYFMPEDSDPTMMRVFGTIFVLFGFYRLALYRANKKRYRSRNDEN